jgi:hypothetical protein
VELEKKAKQLVKEGRVKKQLETSKRIHFDVYGDTEKHSVIFDKTKSTYYCDCRYWSLKQKECSHIKAVKMLKK